jgi:hypothetical protein
MSCLLFFFLLLFHTIVHFILLLHLSFIFFSSLFSFSAFNHRQLYMPTLNFAIFSLSIMNFSVTCCNACPMLLTASISSPSCSITNVLCNSNSMPMISQSYITHVCCLSITSLSLLIATYLLSSSLLQSSLDSFSISTCCSSSSFLYSSINSSCRPRFFIMNMLCVPSSSSSSSLLYCTATMHLHLNVFFT